MNMEPITHELLENLGFKKVQSNYFDEWEIDVPGKGKFVVLKRNNADDYNAVHNQIPIKEVRDKEELFEVFKKATLKDLGE